MLAGPISSAADAVSLRITRSFADARREVKLGFQSQVYAIPSTFLLHNFVRRDVPTTTISVSGLMDVCSPIARRASGTWQPPQLIHMEF